MIIIKKHIRKIVLLIFCLSVLHFSQAQDSSVVVKPKKNALFIEAFGKGYFYSLNYERYFYFKKDLKTSFRVGATYFGVNNYDLVAIPYGINFALGKKKGHFELGIGQTFTFYGYYDHYYDPYYSNLNSYLDKNHSTVYLANHLSFGYKLLPPKGGIFLSFYGMIWLPNITLASTESIPRFILRGYEGTTAYPYIGFDFGYIFQ